ncbi:Eukaryotic translation initiation factor 4E type 3-A [Elsinoe australis]|uniref:Eukaryotic translation initiation factor 4E type 3-A n=1 Tax=Elsinoe australis TaxID=40998 RepID=A0A2P7Z4A5_9PEZI|nr:Eukaryotic translation initiation factor 4E type 3-A [Elsinoe australis]
MSSLPRLEVNELPAASKDETSATASPARGREMKQNLLSKLRAPPLVHAWDFWHDRQDRKPTSTSTSGETTDVTSETKYEDRLLHLSAIADVKAFWSTFNNFDITALPLRDSVHLFHRGVKPVWEDPRNTKGGSWTFRVPKDKAPEFWKEVCMMAIGEQLQAAVESKRITFRDDICGVSLSVRFNSILVQIWNRDAEHKEGVDKILETVLEGLPGELKPRDGSYYYKKHAEHAGFTLGEGAK